MGSICFINGSPKGKQSTSRYFVDVLSDMIDEKKHDKSIVDVRTSLLGNTLNEDLSSIASSDVLIISFPLYVYCLPGILTRFLEEYYLIAKEKFSYVKDIKVYVIVNCGFPEAKVNNEGIRVIKNFCKRLNLNYRFAVSVGVGPFIDATKDVPLLKRASKNVIEALHEIHKDIENGCNSQREDILVTPKIPKSWVLKMGAKGWVSAAKKNGLSVKDLYRTPYRVN